MPGRPSEPDRRMPGHTLRNRNRAPSHSPFLPVERLHRPQRRSRVLPPQRQRRGDGQRRDRHRRQQEDDLGERQLHQHPRRRLASYVSTISGTTARVRTAPSGAPTTSASTISTPCSAATAGPAAARGPQRAQHRELPRAPAATPPRSPRTRPRPAPPPPRPPRRTPPRGPPRRGRRAAARRPRPARRPARGPCRAGPATPRPPPPPARLGPQPPLARRDALAVPRLQHPVHGTADRPAAPRRGSPVVGSAPRTPRSAPVRSAPPKVTSTRCPVRGARRLRDSRPSRRAATSAASGRSTRSRTVNDATSQALSAGYVTGAVADRQRLPGRHGRRPVGLESARPGPPRSAVADGSSPARRRAAEASYGPVGSHVAVNSSRIAGGARRARRLGHDQLHPGQRQRLGGPAGRGLGTPSPVPG